MPKLSKARRHDVFLVGWCVGSAALAVAVSVTIFLWEVGVVVKLWYKLLEV